MAECTYVSEVVPKTDDAGRAVVAARLENQIVSLDTPLLNGAEVRPLTRADRDGFTVYRHSLVFLLAKCAAECCPKSVFRVRHSIGPALWCTISSPEGGAAIHDTAAVASKLRAALDGLVARDEPIAVEPVPYREAVERFTRLGRHDELNLLRHRNPPVVLLARCGDFVALAQTALAPSTGALPLYDVVPVDDGIVLNVPSTEHPDEVLPLPYVEPYFKVFRRQSARTAVTGVETVGDLNGEILAHRFPALVRTVEAMQTKELAEIADRIATRNPPVRLVLLAGPSSAGKTTTAHRLCTQLRVNGVRPLLLSTDDYFVGDARNPRDASGKLDYEHLACVDSERLSSDLNALFAGKPVHLRKFDFLRHEGFDMPDETSLPPAGVVVLEGIHALNPKLTAGVPEHVKFRIFLNAMTQLVLDSCNRISASDTRLLRRLVRDFHFRGTSPLKTFALWPNVVAGERKWIYPFQTEADAVFNSSLDYELAVLKPFAAELLNQVKPWDGAYVEARRLSGLLHNVSMAAADSVPGDSILRETIGSSQLEY